MAIELEVPTSEIGENEVYSPRFIDEIADEIDTLEDKKDSLFCEYSTSVICFLLLIGLRIINYSKICITNDTQKFYIF